VRRDQVALHHCVWKAGVAEGRVGRALLSDHPNPTHSPPGRAWTPAPTYDRVARTSRPGPVWTAESLPEGRVSPRGIQYREWPTIIIQLLN
jgi:hypothetical protein